MHGTLTESVGRYPAGTPYSAEDPALLLWVHATLMDSIVLAFEQLIEPLTPQERDQFVAESSDTAVQLGVPFERVPQTWADLQGFMRRVENSGAIAVTPRARAIADALFSPPLGPTALPITAL